ncbi:MAG: hypothetical protein JXR05_12410 [Flavobacteriaceae bacterium]
MLQLRNIIILALLNFSLMGCQGEMKEIKNTEKISVQATDCPKYILKNRENNLNISVLLDLSDRIEKKNTIQKDSAYLSSLSKAFVNHVKKKQLILLEDRMQVFFNPIPDDNKINRIAEKLRIQFTRDTHKEDLDKTISLYSEYPAQLYTLAKKDAKAANKYLGSDIWGFFKYHIKDYCIDECHRNILVILTDGYMYHKNMIKTKENQTSYITPKSMYRLGLNKSDWREVMKNKNLGFIPIENKLNDLEVLVIGVESDNEKNPYARDILEKYWSNWFDTMNIRNYKIKSADIPSSIEKVIFDFINR